MPIVEIKKANINLWLEYHALDLIEEFHSLREKEGDEVSNNILKAIYYIYDPKSDLYDSGFSEEENIKQVSKNILGSAKFPWKKYEKVKEAWFKFCLTKTDVLMKEMDDEVAGFNKMIKEWTWDKKDATEKSAAMKAYNTLFADRSQILTQFTNEKYERDEMEGGYQLSVLEEYAETT